MTKIANITVAIATLDRPHGLARCLDAVLSGDVLPAEAIIVDQSRDDATRPIVNQRQICMVPLHYIRQERRGLSASRNAAIDRASYPVLAVTDDDCVPDRGWIAAIDRAFAGPSAPDAVTGRILPLGPDVPNLYVVSLRQNPIRKVFSGKVMPWRVGSGGNFAVRRDWHDRIGCYDERLGAGSPGKAAEDADFLYRLLRANGCVQYEPDAIIYHERQSKAQRMAARWTYGYGLGAFCGKWLRRGDPYALRIFGRWLLWQSQELAIALKHRQWMHVNERLLSLRGTLSGILYGLGRRMARQV